MATNSDNRTAGGKIIRSRKNSVTLSTPYSRPSPVPKTAEEEVSGNPNWISNLIYPIKFIASGAGKVISFFGNDYDDESSSEDDDSVYDDDEVYEVENDGFDQVISPASTSDSKRKIDQLVMEATFSREEGEQLIRLVKSRIVDTNVNFGEDTPPAKKTAILEAKKWLQEKRSGSKNNLEAELDLTSSQLTRKDEGSPADVAKSYMQNRPTWLSSSSKQAEYGSPSALGMLHFKEETPTSTLCSSERKKDSFAVGSWNLLDEIRKVRTKATEDLLATTPLTKPRLSMFPPANIKGDVEEPGPESSAHGRPDHALNDVAANSFQDGNAVQLVEHLERPEAFDVSVSNYVKDIEVTEVRSTIPENGSVASGDVQQNTADEPRPQPNHKMIIGSSQQEQDDHVENSNPSTDHNQITTDTDPLINGSRSSSSMHEEDSSQDISQTTMDEDDDPTFTPKEARKESKLRSYTRRGRGRGK